MLAVVIESGLDLLPRQLLMLFRHAINAANIAVRLHDQVNSDAGMSDARIAAGYARCFSNRCVGHAVVARQCHIKSPIKNSVNNVEPLTGDWIVVNHIQPIAVLLPEIERF